MTIKKIMLNDNKEPLFIEDITGKKFLFPGVSSDNICLADVSTILIGVYSNSNKLYGLIERTPDYQKILSEINLSKTDFETPLYTLWKNTTKTMCCRAS